MASRRDSVYEEREFYRDSGPSGPPPRRRSPPRGGRYSDFDDREPVPLREREATQVRIRERSRSRDRTPAFLREQESRPAVGGGAMVLRSRQVETVERPRARPRSPSPAGGVRIREERFVRRARSLTPPPPREMVERDRVEVRERVIERDRDVGRMERIRSPSRGPVDRVSATRVYERERRRSPSPVREVQRTRVVETRRGRSPSPVVAERERIHIDLERERYHSPSPSPSPPPQPEFIRGPTIEREVITHYRDIDHGVMVVRPPSPPPPPRRKETRERDIDIDIYSSRHKTEVDVDIHESSRERRAPSRERLPPPPVYQPRPHTHYDDDVHVHTDRDGRRLEVEVDIHSHKHSHGRERSRSRRRAHSAMPARRNEYYDDDDEGAYITSKIESRGKMGEAYHGATKDWTIVDVPPGTERVKMDGMGGGGADVTWSKYSGVRRAKFVPERERDGGASLGSTSLVTTSVSDRERERESRLSVAIYDKEREMRERETSKEVTTVDIVTDRRASAPQKTRNEMWTEITKDLVIREAIEELGYEYEETEWFFYVMTYLRYEDVLQLVQLSDRIRKIRKDRIREIQWEREDRAEWERRHRHREFRREKSRSRHHRHSRSRDRVVDETVVTRDVVYERPGYR